jgi:hypothetical protein
LEKDRLSIGYSGEVIKLDDYDHLVAEIFRKNLMVVTEGLVPSIYPFFYDTVQDDHSKVVCTKKGKPTSAMIRRKQSRRWITRAETWDGHATPEFLKYLEGVFEYAGIGTHPTPSALGLAYMQFIWTRDNLHNHTTPNGFATDFIRAHMVGGRVDTPGIGERYKEATYFDEASAHLAKFAHQATGTSYTFTDGLVLGFADWFAHCIVTIHKELALGPFPRRLKGGKLTYPTLPGKYNAYLWKGQYDDCIEKGCDVKVLEGVGWKRMTDEPGVWMEAAYMKRFFAPSKELEKSMKKQINAAIGRHAMAGSFHVIVPSGRESRGDEPLGDQMDGHGVAVPFFIHEDKTENSSSMVHWYSRTVTETSRDVFKFAYPYAEKGELVATNYDGVIVRGYDERGEFLVKKSLDDIIYVPGTWIKEQLTNLYVKAPRTYICDQMTVTPGVKRSKR